jgi:micrococcal nuclease
MFQYPAQVLRIVDGDTLWLNLDLGFRIHTEVDVRLAHINTPETQTYSLKGATDPAFAYVQSCLPIGASVVVDIVKQEKYGRWLAVIYFQPGKDHRDDIMNNPRILNHELVEHGLAKPYEGGKK